MKRSLFSEVTGLITARARALADVILVLCPSPDLSDDERAQINEESMLMEQIVSLLESVETKVKQRI